MKAKALHHKTTLSFLLGIKHRQKLHWFLSIESINHIALHVTNNIVDGEKPNEAELRF